MENKIKIEAIKNKSEFDHNLTLKRIFVDINGKEKTAYFRTSHHFLAVSSLDRINHLVERAINELIPKFEINNVYFFDIDTQTFFSQLETKPDWTRD